MKTVFAFISALAVGAAVCAAPASAADMAALPSVDTLPPGVVKVSPVVPRMGEHYADPATLPLGPIYCVHDGKVICLEFMISQEDFAAGKSWPDLRGIEGLPPIDHVNMGFEPHGHEGFEVPHYDMHLYFVKPEVLDAIK